MLVVEVELLTGRYAATAHDDRRRAEWPPHPARFFSALVAALQEVDAVDPAEEAAVRWLESQPAPSLELPLQAAVSHRQVRDVYVPVNDVSILGAARDIQPELDDVDLALAGLAPDAPKKMRNALVSRRARLLDTLTAATQPSAKSSAADVKAAVALLPERRTRQVRTFPVVVLSEPRFAFIWPEAMPQPMQPAFDALCARVTRLGHSSSLVRCARTEREAAPTLVPVDDAPTVLRVVGPGQLDRLRAAFERHQAVESRVLPARPQCYAAPSSLDLEPVVRGVFGDDWIVFQRCGGARLRASRGPELARALRAALLEAGGANAPLPPSLSGHEADSRPAKVPHLAFVALPNVGHVHADGAVLGCAIVLPAELAGDDRRTLLRRIAAWEGARSDAGVVELAAPGLPPVRLQRVEMSELRGLRAARWCRPSRHFLTATPIALDRYPGNLRSNQDGTAQRAAVEAQRCVAEACARIGLPRPAEVEVSLTPLLPGTQPGHDFRGWTGRPQRAERVRVHARIRFDEPVAGPLLLGAGRHFGLGLCLPVSDTGEPA